jgi:hypothetical protein
MQSACSLRGSVDQSADRMRRQFARREPSQPQGFGDRRRREAVGLHLHRLIGSLQLFGHRLGATALRPEVDLDGEWAIRCLRLALLNADAKCREDEQGRM